MKCSLLWFTLGVTLCGAALTCADRIRFSPPDRGDAYIRRATPHVDWAAVKAEADRLNRYGGAGILAQMPSQPTAHVVSFSPPAARVQTASAHVPGKTVVYAASLPTAPSYAAPDVVLRAPVAAAPVVKEYALKLDQEQSFFAGGRRIPIQLHDYGSETIGVRVDYGRYQRLQKQTNADAHEMGELTLIWQSGTIRAFHFNNPRAPIGCYLIRVTGDNS